MKPRECLKCHEIMNENEVANGYRVCKKCRASNARMGDSYYVIHVRNSKLQDLSYIDVRLWWSKTR